MKTYQKVMGMALTLGLLAAPAYAIVESGTAPARELTLADFQRSAGKPVQAWEQYRQYKQRLKHPAPQATLETSRMRLDPAEMTLSEYVSSSGTKPSVAFSKYREIQRNKGKVVTREPYVAPAFTSSGKPSVDWWKARQLKG